MYKCVYILQQASTYYTTDKDMSKISHVFCTPLLESHSPSFLYQNFIILELKLGSTVEDARCQLFSEPEHGRSEHMERSDVPPPIEAVSTKTDGGDNSCWR